MAEAELNSGESWSEADASPSAPEDALLEMVVEGTTHSCNDGTILGTEGSIARQILGHYEQLEPRHLLFGQESGRWFVFTPLTVRQPFWLDNVRLKRGERATLGRVRHHLALDDLRIGLRLKPLEGGIVSLLRLFRHRN